MNVSDVAVSSTVSNFTFSAQKADSLQASEYTIVGIAVDVSSSVYSFKSDLEKAYKTIIGACRKNPKADNLLIRATAFSNNLSELHGFVTLDNIQEDAISLNVGGSTALYDSTLESVESIVKYAGTLTSMEYLVNGVMFIITDGEENSSKVATTAKIKKAIDDVKRSESLESLKTILIGVGVQGNLQNILSAYQTDVGIDQFVWVDSIDAKSIAKIADFVSRSISSSSQSLGTGGASQNLTV